MDLAWTDEQWYSLFQKMGMIICSYNELDALQERYRKQRCVVESGYDIGKLTEDWVLYDVKYRVDTDDAGNIYVVITESGGDYTVELYNDEARTTLVAQGTRTGAGSVDLAAETGYTVNGSVTLTASITTDTNIYLHVKNDYRLRIYDDYQDIRQYEADMRASLDSQFRNSGATILNLRARASAAFDSFLTNYLSNLIESGNSSIDTKYLEYATDGSASTNWGRSILSDLYDAMKDNSGGTGAPYVGANTTAAGSLTADADNTGVLEKISVKCDQYNWVPNGKLTIECTGEGVGVETFELRYYDDDLATYVNGASGFALKIQYIDLDLGILLGLQATYTDAGDLATHTSTWYTDGETEDNSDAGVWYIDYVHTTKLVNIYKDSGKAAADLVAQGTWNTTPGSTVTCSAQNGSGLTVTVKMDTDPTANKSGTLTINSPQIGDKWYIDYTNAWDNVWASFFGKVYKYQLLESGDYEIPETLACVEYIPDYIVAVP